MKWFTILTTIAIIGLASGAVHADDATRDDFKPPPDLRKGWYARIETSKGRIIALLHPEQAPQTVAHFAALANGTLEWTDPVSGEKTSEPYYDGVRVFKAEAGARFEAADQRLDGKQAPLLYVPPELDGPVTFTNGLRLGMTRYTSARISAVQFFATAASQPFLNGYHPCFGTVIEGGEVIFNISAVKTYSSGRPIDPVTIDLVRVFKVGEPEPLPEPVEYRPQRTEMRSIDDLRKPE